MSRLALNDMPLPVVTMVSYAETLIGVHHGFLRTLQSL